MSWLYFEEHLKRGLKRVRLLLLSAPWFCCGPRLEICSWSLMRGAAWSSVEHRGSLRFRRRIRQMLVYVDAPRHLVSFRFPPFSHLLASVPMHCRGPLCLPSDPPQFQSQSQTSAVFFFLQFFIFFPSSVPELRNVCHFSSRSFSFLSSLLNIPCRFGLISGPFFFFSFFSEMPPPYRLWPFRLHFVPMALARMPRGSVSINPQSPALTRTHSRIHR